jgi:hypothetical protein
MQIKDLAENNFAGTTQIWAGVVFFDGLLKL